MGRFIPGLRAAPWHTTGGFDKGAREALEAVKQTLEAAQQSLREEFYALKVGGRLMRERECIHEHSNGGVWSQFQINGFWQGEVDRAGCSVDSPVACALLRRLEAAAPTLRMIRAGYSAVGPGTHLKPHFGMTNGQLKMHLGLVVPRGQGGKAGGDGRRGGEGKGKAKDYCASLRVANTSEFWKERKVLFFDDSFEHEVWNRCEEERVVFQVVFSHPDLPSDASAHAHAGAVGKATGSSEL